MQYLYKECIQCFSKFTVDTKNSSHRSSQSFCNIQCANIFNSEKIKNANIEKYNLDPKFCLHCNNQIPYEKRANKYCSSSCAASQNNHKRAPKSEETIIKLSNSIKEYHKNKPAIVRPVKIAARKIPKKRTMKYALANPSGPFSKLFHCICQHCGKLSIIKIQRKYCVEHQNLYSDDIKYKFLFDVYNFPDFFNLDDLKKFGWFSTGGNKPINLNGMSRDHKVSVNESIRNSYDPFYITHLLNCELMVHKENNLKKSKSSITYEELVRIVDEFEQIKY